MSSVKIIIPKEYEPNYTPDDLPYETTKEEMIDEINRLRSEVNQLLKISGLTQMRKADWIHENVGGGKGRNYTVEG